MQITTIPIPAHPRRGTRAPRIALVGLRGAGKEAIFDSVASTSVTEHRLAGCDARYAESRVEVGLEQAVVLRMPHLSMLDPDDPATCSTFRHLLWGDRWPPAAAIEPEPPRPGFAAPDVLIQVIDATALSRHLELTLALSQLGRPMVIALNRVDELRARGLYINVPALEEALGVPVVATVGHMGKGVGSLFDAAMRAAHSQQCPLPQPPSPYLQRRLQDIALSLHDPAIAQAFAAPLPLLALRLAQRDRWFSEAFARCFPQQLPVLQQTLDAAAEGLPRPLAEELDADRHHRCAKLFETVTRVGRPGEQQTWKHLADRLFLHPRWGLLGSLGVFALVLFMVFELSATLDALSVAPLNALLEDWTPTDTGGIVLRAVCEGLIGLVGIVVPYMLPLVLLLVVLEESGVMHRVAFVVDRGFHRIGLHGGVALPFLLGLGCNVPAISAAAHATQGRERLVSALLITFVPCSARSAIVLALGGKYLGGLGVFALFMLILGVIAIAGHLLSARLPSPGPGLIQQIPAYARPRLRSVLGTTWARTQDILTIVTPLLVAGSVVMALLAHWQADQLINTLLTPVTAWWLGLPVALGVPILFGVLRKELSLLMIYQALGSLDIAPLLSPLQIATFLVFLSFYVPCVSTFAVMMRHLGTRGALWSLALSVGTALGVAGALRLGGGALIGLAELFG